MMFRFSALLAALLFAVGLSSPAEAGTVTFTDAQGISYSADDAVQGDGATVTGYVGTDQSVDIPTTVNIGQTDYAVTTISNLAFYGSQLTSVAIPDSVTTINNFAFAANQLISVTIGDGVISIGDQAFANNDLPSVTIPSGVTTIGASAFYDNQLASVTIPDSVTSLGDGAFSSNMLTSVTIGDGITSIGDGVFISNQLTDVTIPKNVTSIGFDAFGFNQGLATVRFLGDAPTVVDAGSYDGPGASFDTTNTSLLLTYPAEFGDPPTSGGYTTPTWHGYNTASTGSPVTVFNPGPTATITGGALVGSTLTAGENTASPTPTSYAYQWYADGQIINGATNNTFTLTTAQLGKKITVEVIATKDGYTDASDTSAPTASVTNPPVPPVTCGGKTATLKGTAGNDTLTGTAGPDVIAGLGGNDKITGAAGNDLICGGGGNDTLDGGSGTDKLEGGAGGDNIIGGSGSSDRCDGGSGTDSGGSGCETKVSLP